LKAGGYLHLDHPVKPDDDPFSRMMTVDFQTPGRKYPAPLFQQSTYNSLLGMDGMPITLPVLYF
jgi:hypothetical protein